VTNYTLDLNAGLTQVLTDGTNTYTYGLGRISQQSGNDPEYFLGDALGSVRQLTDQSGQVTYAKSYDPYGVVTQASGEGQSVYGFTGEMQDVASGMVYLRSRFYNVADGRFLTKDPSGAESNLYLYARSNPVNYSDPTGYFSQSEIYGSFSNVPGSWGSFLNAWGNMKYSKWGFLAALSDAEPGDRLVAYKYNIRSLHPSLEKVADATLSTGMIDTGPVKVNSITANGTGLSRFFTDNIYYGGVNVESYRGYDARYYFLYSRNNGLKAYIDGNTETDYPDYKIVSLGISDTIKASVALEAFLRGSIKCGISISGSMIIDRYGYKYLALTGSYGIGFSFASYGEGYVTNNVSSIWHTASNESDATSLQKNIMGFGLGATEVIGLGGSASTGWQIWDGNSPKSFAFLEGTQASLSVDVFNVFPPFSYDPSSGWQWALQAEAQGYGGKAYFRSDF
jgi:RHS repeat-associated protein